MNGLYSNFVFNPLKLYRLTLLDPRYLRTELLDELTNCTLDKLPPALTEHMGNVLKSISRLECYATGNVDQDGVSLTLNHFSQYIYDRYNRNCDFFLFCADLQNL